MASRYENAIVFIERDMCTTHPYHNKSFFVETNVNEYLIWRVFIDDGSLVNLKLLSTLKALKINLKGLFHPMTITFFNKKEIKTLGQVMVSFKMGLFMTRLASTLLMLMWPIIPS
ncbi:Uncharacterized protein TCM_024707 [Theobroma cacao]|uniref:Uncharacterized protein n=1 Tax=Theobroma cacao TaxID=3641 RepID=A0A061EW31_THECC|nr:Uncharacterized protein TCM_024707 [Theobroma cacao]